MEKRSFNLCSTYMLPLLGLNKFSFGATNDHFVNCYIDETNTCLVVELKTPFTSIITNNKNYRFGYELEGRYFGVFDIPAMYHADVELFRAGQYSKLSHAAKEAIKRKSGLKYKVPKHGGGTESAIELLALDKDPDLKKHLESQLGVKLDQDAELASIPGEENFITLNITT